MDDLELVVRGALAALAISVSVGPVNVFCVSRTIARGPVAGILSGLGAATADTVYGGIAGFSISFVIDFLIRELFWIRLFGGLLLIGMGVRYYFRKSPGMGERRNQSGHSEFVTAFLLNLTNPTTVLSFLAVLALLGMSRPRAMWNTAWLVGGMFAGAMLWWTTLAFIVGHFRDRFDDRAMMWMDRIAGLAIGGFGVVTLLLARHRPG